MIRVLTLILLIISLPVMADGRLGTVMHVPIKASAALVVNVSTNDILYEKNIDDIRSIASITKLMTAMVTLDAKLPMDEMITISKEDVNATKLRGKPSSKTLVVGTTLTREELLHLALMNSQNRAAAALARTYPGGMPTFVTAMNKKAQSLEMNDTTFVDPTGLISSNKSTATDLAIMLEAAFQYDVIRNFSTSTSYVITPNIKQQHKVEFRTTNRLLTKKDWNIVIQKTGYIHNAGRCMVLMTENNDQRFIIVLLNTEDVRTRANDAISLMYWIQNGDSPSKAELTSYNPYPVCKHKRHTHHHKHHHVVKRT